MKIGIDIREIKKVKLTGTGRYLIEFLKQAAKNNNFEFILFGNQFTDFALPDVQNFTTIVVKENFTFYYDQIELSRQINKNKIVLFYSPYPKIPIFSRIKKISSFFDLTYLVVEPYKEQLKNLLYKNYLLSAYAKNSDKIIALSQKSKDDIIRTLKINSDKISVVYPSVSDKFFPGQKSKIAEVKKKFNIDKKYILYVGNSNAHKNLLRLIEAYNNLPEGIKKEYILVIAGVGDFFNSQLNSKLINFVPDDDLPVLYGGAELFVFPSLYEGFGLPPLEAMACGCPVVSSNTSSMPEVLGDACEYFNPCNVKDMSDKIKYLLKNENAKNELRQKGFERVKLYTTEKMSKSLLNIFQSLITNH